MGRGNRHLLPIFFSRFPDPRSHFPPAQSTHSPFPIPLSLQFETVADALKARRSIVDGLMTGVDPFSRLRTALRRQVFDAAGKRVDLQPVVASLDARTRKEGLHLTQAWDFAAQRFSADTVPVLLLDYCQRLAVRESDDRMAVAVLLDQYFVTVLSLLAVRAWDDGDANANLDRVSGLLDILQGEGGSGQPFIDDAESLLFLSISYFHPQEVAYDVLLARVERLSDEHQVRVARACAGMMSAHLRWGLRFMYERDLGRMRDDNVADYPWLAHAVATLARAYDRQCAASAPPLVRDVTAESLLLGLAADPTAFLGDVPRVLESRAGDVEAVRSVVSARRAMLRDDFERLRVESSGYSPLSFTCNFPTNAAVALVAVTLEDGVKYPSLNALFTRGTSDASAAMFAERLMQYSASDPSRLGAGGAPLCVNDPREGASAHNAVLRALAG